MTCYRHSRDISVYFEHKQTARKYVNGVRLVKCVPIGCMHKVRDAASTFGAQCSRRLSSRLRKTIRQKVLELSLFIQMAAAAAITFSNRLVSSIPDRGTQQPCRNEAEWTESQGFTQHFSYWHWVTMHREQQWVFFRKLLAAVTKSTGSVFPRGRSIIMPRPCRKTLNFAIGDVVWYAVECVRSSVNRRWVCSPPE